MTGDFTTRAPRSGRSRPGSFVPGAALLAVLLGGIAPAAPVQDDGVHAVLEILAERRESDERSGGIRKQLVDLGPDATTAVFDLLAGRVTGLGPQASLDAPSRALVYDVLRSWPARKVVSRIDARVDARSPLGERMVALRLLGEVGDATAMPVVSDIVVSFTPEEARPVQVRATIETTLRKILIRDRSAYGDLSDMVGAVGEHHLPPIVEALGEGGGAKGQPILERLLGRSDELDLLVLEALGKMDRWDPDADFERCARVVRRFLDSPDPLFRRQAAVSLGRLGDGESVADLIEALEDDDRRVKRGALWGLHEITNLRFDGHQERWLVWQAEQAEWYDSRSTDLAALLQAAEVGRAVAALREIGEHRLFAGELIEDVAAALRHESPEVAAYACGTLAQLAHPAAFPFLLEALDDTRNMVRAAAGRSLQVLTGQTFPPASNIWREWAESGKPVSPRS